MKKPDTESKVLHVTPMRLVTLLPLVQPPINKETEWLKVAGLNMGTFRVENAPPN